ncbi:InlB B-repeat-containing protein [Evansella cellulosilytica]|uniref:Bacterial repeat domain-containing protein n=1 Tax=Evansella cellulosilytica (strain ATCC 21833 / DSM 2522 / FERM P-1141 / JCM 9156 / N-4) TaxID=649639 RepID=E6TT18_EVAC2|nr:tetratricopeptide repeat protein [Evansella cellulosilytica]ADU31926.1 hypothetical protein Bcell_3685 [Evansella cellulosilytica DSM 2522]
MKRKGIVLIVSVLVLVGMGFFTYTVVQSNDFAEQLALAEQYFNEEKYEESKAIYLDILAEDNKHLEARLSLAKCYFSLENWDLVESTLLDGIKLDTFEEQYYIDLSYFYMYKRDIDEAIKTAENGFFRTEATELSHLLNEIESHLHIKIERSSVQVDFNRLLEVVWVDEDEQYFPVQAYYTVDDNEVGVIVAEEEDYYFSAQNTGTATIEASIRSISIKQEIDVREQVLAELLIENNNSPYEGGHISVGEELTLTANGIDYAGEAIPVLPSWEVKNELGHVSTETGTVTHFTANKSGLETIVIAAEDLQKEIHIRIDGDTKILNYEITGEGTLIFSPEEEEYKIDSEVTIEAIAADGWKFSSWDGDLSGSTNPITITMDDHKAFQAIFTPLSHSLELNTEGQGSIQRSSTNTSFDDGDAVTLTANPQSGWRFVRWEGSHRSTTPTITVIMDSNKSLTAVFEKVPSSSNGNNEPETSNRNEAERNNENEQESQEQNAEATFSLTISTASGGKINGAQSGSSHKKGDKVTLTAQPNEGWKFIRWEGDASGSSRTVTVTMDKDKTVRAIFEEDKPKQFTLTTAVEGNGRVEVIGGGSKFDEGTVVELRAIPDSGWRFAGWKETNGQSPTQITMNSNKTMTAIFEQRTEDE